MNKISYLTKDKYLSLIKKYEGGHWTPETIDQRWNYHSLVIELIKMLDIDSPDVVLEMGTMGVSCVNNSDTIDYTERWNYPDKKPTYVQDARIIPWPIKNKQYELFVALRVFQHLTPYQKECTKEAIRISKKLIIVVPDKYENRELPNSKGVTYSDFVDYLDGIHPNLYIPLKKENIYYWDTENPSKISLEIMMQKMTLYQYETMTPKTWKSRFIGLMLRVLGRLHKNTEKSNEKSSD